MEKSNIKLVVITMVMLIIIMFLPNTNFAITINGTSIQNEYQLSIYARDHKSDFFKISANNLVGNYLTDWNIRKWGIGQTSGSNKLKNSACWHYDALSFKNYTNGYYITNVIDIGVGSLNEIKMYGGSNANKNTANTTNNNAIAGKILWALNARQNVGRISAYYDDGLNKYIGNLTQSYIGKGYIHRYFDGGLNSAQKYDNTGYINYWKETRGGYSGQLNNYKKPSNVSTNPKYVSFSETIDGENYVVTGPYKINMSQHSVNNIYVTKDGETEGKAKIKILDGSYKKMSVSQIKNNTNFYIAVKDTKKIKKIEVSLKWNNKAYKSRIVYLCGDSGRENRIQPMVVFAVSTYDKYETINLNCPPEIKDDGQLRIIKSDSSTGELLNGVTFKIEKCDDKTGKNPQSIKVKKGDNVYQYDKNSNLNANAIQTGVNNYNGQININGLPEGWYKITETKTLDGYELNSSYAKGVMVFVWSKSHMKAVYGDTYLGWSIKTMIDTENSKVSNFDTEINRIWKGLGHGDITENYKKNDGYKYMKNQYNLYVKETRTNSEKRTKIVQLMFSYDNLKNQILAKNLEGTGKTLGDMLGGNLDTQVTNNKGEKLTYREFLQRYIKAAYKNLRGKDINYPTVLTYYSRALGATAVNITNAKEKYDGKLRIIKADEQTNQYISGVEFKLYREEDNKKQYIKCDQEEDGGTYSYIMDTTKISDATVIKTNKSGCADIDNLPPGQYHIVEIKTDVQHKLSKEVYDVYVNSVKTLLDKNHYSSYLAYALKRAIEDSKGTENQTPNIDKLYSAVFNEDLDETNKSVLNNDYWGYIMNRDNIKKYGEELWEKAKDPVNKVKFLLNPNYEYLNKLCDKKIKQNLLEQTIKDTYTSDNKKNDYTIKELCNKNQCGLEGASTTSLGVKEDWKKDYIRDYIKSVVLRYTDGTKIISNPRRAQYYTNVLGRSCQVIFNERVYKGNLEILKTDEENSTKKLEGAVFKVKNEDGEYIKATLEDNGEYNYTGTDKDGTSFITNKDGIIKIKGLPASGDSKEDNKTWQGKYTIEEIQAPDGYRITTDSTNVTIDDIYRYGEDYERYLGYALKTMFVGGPNSVVISEINSNLSETRINRIERLLNSIYLSEVPTGISIENIKNNLEEKITNNNDNYNSDTNKAKLEMQWMINYIGENYDDKEIKLQDGTKTSIKDISERIKNNQSTIAKKYFAEVYNKIYNTNITYKNILMDTYYERARRWNAKLIKNAKKYNNLTIQKIDGSTEEPLNNVAFNIQRKSDGKYLTYEEDDEEIKNKIWVSDDTDAYTFVTGIDGRKKGEIYIEDLPEGDYNIIEIALGDNKDYELPENNITKVHIDENATSEPEPIVIKNYKNKYIKISGYVWQDLAKHNGKPMERDNIYTNDEYKIQGIRVTLGEGDYGYIDETFTNENGEYTFENVDSAYLDTYSIAFEYDGITYAAVSPYEFDSMVENKEVPKYEPTTTSKAKEDAEYRKELNNRFNQVTKFKDENGNNNDCIIDIENGIQYIDYDKETSIEDQNISYNSLTRASKRTKQGNTITIGKNADGEFDNGEFTVMAQTKDTCSLKDYYDNYYKGQDEIKNINLGLYEREKPDLSVQKDIFKADVSINGKTGEYNYNQNLVKDEEKTNTTIGVQFQNKRTENYRLPVYKADAMYDSNDKGLNISVTYKIALINESTNLYAKVNSIDEYFTKDYIYKKMYIGDIEGPDYNKEVETKIKENGEINGYKQYNFSNLNINIPSIKSGHNVTYLYIEFEIPKSTYYDNENGKLILDRELKNIVEISSYTTYSDEKYENLYAGIDKDSIPENIDKNNIEDKTKYEDDTNKALGLNIVDAGNRTLKGTVFEDSTSVNKNNERFGDGIYQDSGENPEKTIDNVSVKLREIKYHDNEDGKYDFTGIEKEIKTDKGQYEFSEFIPGDYVVEFEWGKDNGGYDVNDYKGTILKELSRFEWDDWHETDNIRYSDAKDDYNRRVAIDSNDTSIYPDLTKMISTTPSFGIQIETLDSRKDENEKNTYEISNIDFGIAERPRQSVGIKKDVNKVTISDASGRALIDAEIIEENGVKKFKNDVKFATYLPASEGNPFGTIRAEMDNELFPLSINIEYKIEVANNSEVDYKNENYYWYGNASGLTDNDKIKIKPTGVYDYLDKLLDVDKETLKDKDGNKITENIISKSEYKTTIEELPSKTTIFDRQYSEYYDENGNYKKEGTWQTFNSPEYKILEEWAYSKEKTTTEKKLSGVDKIIELTTLEEKELAPGEENSVTFNALGKLAAKDEISIKNDAEITDVIRTTDYGRRVTAKPSYDRGELITITPPTGESKDYTQIIIISISAVVLLGVGIIFIKKKVLK